MTVLTRAHCQLQIYECVEESDSLFIGRVKRHLRCYIPESSFRNHKTHIILLQL